MGNQEYIPLSNADRLYRDPNFIKDLKESEFGCVIALPRIALEGTQTLKNIARKY